MMYKAKGGFGSRVFLLWILFATAVRGQGSFDLQLDTVSIPGLPGLHSFAAAAHGGKWL